MIQSGRLFRSLLGLIAGAWLAILLIGAPIALLVNSSFDEISYFDHLFLTSFGYKNWLDYALREGAPILEVIMVFTVLLCVPGFIIHAVLHRLNWRHLHNYLNTGVLIATGFSLLITLCLFGGQSSFPAAVVFSLFLVTLIFSTLSALMVLLVFWLIRRPDKDARTIK